MSGPGMPGPSQGGSSPAVSPCGACKFLRRKCTKTCIFAPHFPPDQGQRFANVHKIFGASNVAKLLQELPSQNREDAVNSLSYEADARVNDPIYGCVGALFSLQQQVARLQTELAIAQAELARLHAATVQSSQRGVAAGMMMSYDGVAATSAAPASVVGMTRPTTNMVPGPIATGCLHTGVMQPAGVMVGGLSQMGAQQHPQPLQPQSHPHLQTQPQPQAQLQLPQLQPQPRLQPLSQPHSQAQLQPQPHVQTQMQPQLQPGMQSQPQLQLQPQIQHMPQPSIHLQPQAQMQPQPGGLQPQMHSQPQAHPQQVGQHLHQLSGQVEDNILPQSMGGGSLGRVEPTVLQEVQEVVQQSPAQQDDLQALATSMMQDNK